MIDAKIEPQIALIADWFLWFLLRRDFSIQGAITFRFLKIALIGEFLKISQRIEDFPPKALKSKSQNSKSVIKGQGGQRCEEISKMVDFIF